MVSGYHVSVPKAFSDGMLVSGSRGMKFAVQQISGMMKQSHRSSPHYLRVRHWLLV